MFVDHIQIHAKAGKGGRGAVSFRREKFVPRGGPDGGDGGRGGNIILRPDPNVDNLVEFHYQSNLKAKSGENGGSKNCTGRAAQDMIYKVPIGTLIYRMPFEREETGPAPRDTTSFLNLETLTDEEAARLDHKQAPRRKVDPDELELVMDLAVPDVDFVLCKGGDGGKGNVHFKSSRNRVPRQYTDGTEGEEGVFYVELRKIADAGLVGYPNAGKSTLLSRISNAHPKIAPYPFTTLTPHIGVVDLANYRRVTVADIPGLIEGAHENVGLGHDFLRHIVRCKLLIFVIDMAGSEGREPLDDLQKLRKELDLYDPTLSERPWIVVANKMDLTGAKTKLKHFKTRYKKLEIFPVSAEQSEGLEKLKERLSGLIPEEQRVAAAEPEPPLAE
ncbi:MAG: GTPase ObgE [Chthoniobacteraceae bacterium]